MPVTIALTTEEKVLLTLSPQTPNGNPAPVDGEPVWSVTAGDVTLDVQPGGLSAYVVSGAAGTSEVTVTADADMGEGVKTLSDIAAVNVVPAEAAGLGLSVGAPEPK